jgi:rod shape-determining protein MreC
VPRDRTVRLAVLGSSVQRPHPQKLSARTGPALRRRIVMGCLVLLSLVLITAYFREPADGGLHAAQGAGASALRPFQVGIERVVRPFRDAWGWFDGLLEAKADNERLVEELTALRQELAQNKAASQQNAHLRQQLGIDAPPRFDLVPAVILSHAAKQFEQEVVVSVGSDDGVEVNDPVVTAKGLVGRVVHVTSGTARVTLLTDESTYVSAEDADTGAKGLVGAGRAGSGSLVLDMVDKRFEVADGDTVVTSGSRRGEEPSLYPRGIPIGEVSSVGRSDTEIYMQIQVRPFVDFGSLDAVTVLASKERNGG